ncbi:hypothetical protein AXK57_21210 [Tsukamurella pulmonis]|uniref:endonuclease domain-containing protein n=1 Tax=Tsukamurella pulmonis TaxID=47312 RepID=UPI0007977E38|nr:DUF559 domain-containing protein [Tsukamurella pulmonis]KXP11774.1 hypothetical protein AXK57_21210 [Tsukamurella pulmonis]RDH11974.1 DUF559 domain-containing protein [Tsukamurella pulmonis]
MHTIEILEALAGANGGIVSRRAALAAGARAAEIERLRHTGDIVGVRRGWYRLPGADAVVVAAVRAGAVLTCVSALPFHPGVWVPPQRRRVHLRRARHLRTPAHRDCDAAHPMRSPIRAVDSLPDALRCAAHCLDPAAFVAVLDSTLRREHERYTVDDLRVIFGGAAQRVVRLLDFVDPLAGSGTESLVRFHLQYARIKVRSQVVLPGIGRVDLLVGDRLIIECDSTAHHTGQQRLEDNRRDRAATRGGYLVLRIDYSEVIGDWPTIFAEILEIVRSGRHRGPVLLGESADVAVAPDISIAT